MASIQKTLTYLHAGAFQAKASDELTKIVDAVRESGKVGELTIKIKVKPTNGSTRTLTIEGDISAKVPAIKPDATLMFPDEDNELHVDDPRQQRLDLQEVTTAKPALRSA